MRLLIMGAPGAGKGTQATALAARYEVPAISTGDIFRDHIRRQTPLGVKVKELIDAGEYVPDEVTEDIVASRLAEPDCAGGFLLDGFPRTMHQVHFLDRLLEEQGQRIDAVVSLVVEPEVLVDRLLERARIEGRTDDNEDTIRRRMEVYAGQTAPLLFHYEKRGVLVEVEGTGSVDEVRSRMLSAVETPVEREHSFVHED
ncbi:adenylate kinase [Tessaracoccus sp. OS52]|uniref:adenylate kinase n=1 Tax=Tessaracoccus sp. OS52 TaxID=2886691 RepID=UPI001D117BA0|nr:adenylate kinase [Tessaracoccus sp. OS52]MCC2592222.1 adenylate kinase [Tessaracoccus sp. OS52]